jgi:hypothetical protein
MIYEMRTYDIKPRSLPEVEKRFGEAYEKRKKYSELAAFWHTEIGPLNQIIRVAAEDRRVHRVAEVRDHGPVLVHEVVPGREAGPLLRDPNLSLRRRRARHDQEKLGIGHRRAPGIRPDDRRVVLRARQGEYLPAHLALPDARPARGDPQESTGDGALARGQESHQGRRPRLRAHLAGKQDRDAVVRASRTARGGP